MSRRLAHDERDYNSQRYSKLTQINRDNVKNLRIVWGLALAGMQNIARTAPNAEVNPLIDNGFMYTSDGWGGIYKIDARSPTGHIRLVHDLGVRVKANVRRRAASRCGRPRHRQHPDGRVSR